MSQVSHNHIKIGSSTINSVSNGNFSFGVIGGADYGPTSDTGFYNGIPIPVGGYAIYVEKSSGGPSIHAPRTDEECLLYLNKYGANASNISDALTWASTQTNLVVLTSEYQLSDLPNVSSFTINIDSFAQYTTGWHVSASSPQGFSNTGGSNLIDDTYIINTPDVGNAYLDGVAVAQSVGMDYTNYAYAWNVTWADNSTGIVRLGFSTWNSGQIVISPIDLSDTRWQSGDTSSNSKAGTFNFPATFTPYTPLTTLGCHDCWC